MTPPQEYFAYQNRGATVSIIVHTAASEHVIHNVSKIDVYHNTLIIYLADNRVPIMFGEWHFFAEYVEQKAYTGETTRLG